MSTEAVSILTYRDSTSLETMALGESRSCNRTILYTSCIFIGNLRGQITSNDFVCTHPVVSGSCFGLEVPMSEWVVL